jgi:bacteriocin biosynthesis cyclodehydratase domain-containing protein
MPRACAVSRLVWKTYLRPVVMPPDHLVLLSENASHLFQGDVYVRTAGLLDGCLSEDEVQTRLERDGIPPLSARLALSHLRALGVICDSGVNDTPCATSEQGAFWESLGEDSTAVGRRLGLIRAVIRDIGGTGADVLRGALSAAGIIVGDKTENLAPGDFMIAIADDFLDPRLDIVNQEALDRGHPWLIIRLAGTVPWIGPLFVPRKTGCWACLAQRLQLNRQTEQFIEAQMGPAVRAPLPVSRNSLTLAAEFAVVEVLRWFATGRHDALEGGVLTLDIKTNVLASHSLVRRPQCHACGEPRLRRDNGSAEPTDLRPSARLATAGGRGERPEATLARLKHHVSPVTGIVRALTETNENGYLNVAASQSFPMHRYDFRVLRDNLLGRSGGKGFDLAQAQTSALCEALERYSGIWQREEERFVTASRRALGDDAIDPRLLFGFSARQYVERDAWNGSNDEPHAWIPKPLDDDLVIDWTPLWSLSASRTKFIPSAYSYYGHPDLRHSFCSSDSNGCAAGGTLTEAIAHGLLELIERDAAAIWWYNLVPRPAVDLDSIALPLVRELRDLYRCQNRIFWVIDLTTDLRVPVFAALSARTDDPVEDIIYGFGADFDASAAIDKALLEMNQSLFSVFRTPLAGSARYRTDRPAARRWFQTATRANQPYLVPDPGSRPRLPGDLVSPDVTDWQDGVVQCVNLLQMAGLETFVLDQTRPDIGLPVCRVVVPGLCHFWRRFGTRRLYEVPVRMGWQESPRAENELNARFIYF